MKNCRRKCSALIKTKPMETEQWSKPKPCDSIFGWAMIQGSQSIQSETRLKLWRPVKKVQPLDWLPLIECSWLTPSPGLLPQWPTLCSPLCLVVWLKLKETGDEMKLPPKPTGHFTSERLLNYRRWPADWRRKPEVHAGLYFPLWLLRKAEDPPQTWQSSHSEDQPQKTLALTEQQKSKSR